MLEVRLGAPDGTLAGHAELAASGAQQWSTVKAELTAPAGVKDVYLLMSAGVRVRHFEIH
ncbi:Carbohydrate binding module (family 6) [compost metagenome]